MLDESEWRSLSTKPQHAQIRQSNDYTILQNFKFLTNGLIEVPLQ